MIFYNTEKHNYSYPYPDFHFFTIIYFLVRTWGYFCTDMYVPVALVNLHFWTPAVFRGSYGISRRLVSCVCVWGGGLDGHFGTNVRPDISKPTPFIYLGSEKKETHSYTDRSNPPLQILVWCTAKLLGKNNQLIYTNSSSKMPEILLSMIILT